MYKKRNACFYIHPMAHLFGIAGPAQVFWEANALKPHLYRLKFVSFTDQITTAQGLGLSNLEDIGKVSLEKDDLVIIPGVNLKAYLDRPFSKGEKKGFSWIAEQYQSGVQICSIGSGSLILAESGLLNYKKCTSHWKCADYLKANYSKIKFVENKVFITDGRIMTSAGMSANVDTALFIVEEHHGPVFASKVARELLVFIRRFGHETQKSYYLDYKTHFNPLVHRIQNIISSNLSKNFTNAQLAEMVNTSERNLTRAFKKALGESISEFKNNLRIELASHLLHNKSLTISQIAAECGFNDTRQLKRIWKKHFGKPLLL